jgi:hypothetical protein
MVLMDIQESLLTAIYNLLTIDDTLKAKMNGSVRLYLTWAPPDAIFPYLVHRLDIRPLADYSPQSKSTYLIDIWSHSPSAKEILDIRERLMALLDGLDSSTGETSEYWLWKGSDGFVPETEQGIWHYAMMFNLKHLTDAQVGVLLKR